MFSHPGLKMLIQRFFYGRNGIGNCFDRHSLTNIVPDAMMALAATVVSVVLRLVFAFVPLTPSF